MNKAVMGNAEGGNKMNTENNKRHKIAVLGQDTCC